MLACATSGKIEGTFRSNISIGNEPRILILELPMLTILAYVDIVQGIDDASRAFLGFQQ